VISDYRTPEGKVLSRDLGNTLNSAIQFLVECRPLCVSMGNAIKFVKTQVAKLEPSTPEDEAKRTLVDKINDYIQVRVRSREQRLDAQNCRAHAPWR
jgi:translation initiation factor eIF-2B subunit delta